MDEIQHILTKYDRTYLERLFASKPEADQLALAFFEDVAEILDILSRMKNGERNPTGFSIDDAPILGLLVRTWKLLKLIIWIYKEDSAEYAAIAERSLIEVAVTATYLLRSDKSTLKDYRRCSYRNRFRMLEQAASGSKYYRSKAVTASCVRSTKNSRWRGWMNTASKIRSATIGACRARRFTRSSRK